MEGEDFGKNCKKQFCNKHFHPEAHFCKKENQKPNQFEDILRLKGYIPLVKLGQDNFGCIYLCYDFEICNIFAVGIIHSDKYDQSEIDASFDIHGKPKIFKIEFIGIVNEIPYQFIALNFECMNV
ncbi:MAG: hypothetical protein EZS28_005065 [Streblomastix strix]|uniref:Uncharacterized protein n=1 Tax=Streblomastix strix TaxID=222440 RepID=A0A5J4WXW9_9EUKA|nr:MAG: hypothetical protein EZS28_005065 [Streblomastix strix]